jgi:hypothetical protein
MGKKSGSGSGMNKPDHISESLETIFWVKILKFFDADPGSGPWEKFGSGINILDPQHWNFVLLRCRYLLSVSEIVHCCGSRCLSQIREPDFFRSEF